jgi:hypothetical protein
MTNRLVVGIIAAISFLASFLILSDQKLKIGIWFQIQQVLHHETFAIIFFVFGIGFLVGAVITKARQ